MDVISHILIGKIISFFDKKTKMAWLWAMAFSALPDLFLIPAYLYLGISAENWKHTRDLYPILHAFTWEIPHSVFFIILIIMPVILFFKLPKIAFFAYLIHIIIDIPAHAGEWALKPFYPLNYSIDGVANVWAWPVWAFPISWIILIFIIFVINDYSSKSGGRSS